MLTNTYLRVARKFGVEVLRAGVKEFPVRQDRVRGVILSVDPNPFDPRRFGNVDPLVPSPSRHVPRQGHGKAPVEFFMEGMTSCIMRLNA